MSTVTAILEPDADGTVHVPVPAGLPQGKVKVTATFEAAEPSAPAETVEERRRKIEAACEKLRELGTFSSIMDPVEWQREIRRDRPLPGRD
ncbi:MAG: hypothetical protein Q7S40_17810 [Opitutaceae bacterium]|nr:hypothetical protein [Opitutaceae bacterium]